LSGAGWPGALADDRQVGAPSPPAVGDGCWGRIWSSAEDAPVGVLAIAGRKRLALDEPEGALAVGLPLGAKEQGRCQLL
jgi:hypothetical protein